MPLLEVKALDQLPDLTGTLHAITPGEGKVATVVVFVSPYCPTANTLMPEIVGIMAEHADKVDGYVIHSDKDAKDSDVQQHMELYKITTPVLLDKEQKVAKELKAKITPEAVVLGKDGAVLYQGKINDLYLKPTRKQREATTHDLRDALEAVIAGEAVKNSHTEPVGCKISGME